MTHQEFEDCRELSELRGKVKRFEKCHIWEDGDKLSRYADNTEILIRVGDIRELIYQEEQKRLYASRINEKLQNVKLH